MIKIKGFSLIEFCVVIILTGVMIKIIASLYLTVDDKNSDKAIKNISPSAKLNSAYQVLLSNMKSTGVLPQPVSSSNDLSYASGDFPFFTSEQVELERMNYSVNQILIGNDKPYFIFDPGDLIRKKLLPVVDDHFAVCLRLIRLTDFNLNNSDFAIMISEKDGTDRLTVSPYQLLKSTNCISRMSELAAVSKSYLALLDMKALSEINVNKYSGDVVYYVNLEPLLIKKRERLYWQRVNTILEMSTDDLAAASQGVQIIEAAENLNFSTIPLLGESIARIIAVTVANSLVLVAIDKVISFYDSKIQLVAVALAATKGALQSAQLALGQLDALLKLKFNNLILLYARGISE